MINKNKVITITNLSELNKYKNEITMAISKTTNPWFCFDAIKSMMLAYKNIYLVYINRVMLCAFKKRNMDILESMVDVEPIYNFKKDKSKNWYNIFDYLLEITNSKAIYFPLVYEKSEFYKHFNKSPSFQNYKRLYTSICDIKDLNDVNKKMIYSYLHKNNINQINKLFCVERYTRVNVIDKLTKIEINSWKSVVQQDLVTKKEDLIFYNEMVKQGIVTCTILEDKQNKTPIAYRLDYVEGNKLIQLKTSYNENYKKYKPGTYLLLYDLLRMQNIEHIDLYGGPNTIKNTIETRKIDRYDFLYGENSCSEKLIENRINWDKRNWNNFIERKGIRNVYEEFKR